MKRTISAGLALAGLLAPGLVMAQTVGVGTMPQGTVSFSTGSAIAKVLNETAGLETRVQPNTGETVLIPLVNQGEIDVGIANVLEAAEAYEGKATFDGQPQSDLRIAAVLYPLRVGIFVRDDSDIESCEDLKGKRVTTGFSAMGSIETVLASVLANCGLTVADVKPVPVPNVVKGAEQFQNERADAFFFAVGAAKVSEVDASTPVRLVPLSSDEAAEQRMKEVFPYGYLIEVQPAPNLAGVKEPTYLLGYDNVLLTSTHTDEETVQAVAKGLAENKDALVESFPLFRGFDPDRMVKEDMPIPYHPGTEAWAASR